MVKKMGNVRSSTGTKPLAEKTTMKATSCSSTILNEPINPPIPPPCSWALWCSSPCLRSLGPAASDAPDILTQSQATPAAATLTGTAMAVTSTGMRPTSAAMPGNFSSTPAWHPVAHSLYLPRFQSIRENCAPPLELNNPWWYPHWIPGARRQKKTSTKRRSCSMADGRAGAVYTCHVKARAPGTQPCWRLHVAVVEFRTDGAMWRNQSPPAKWHNGRISHPLQPSRPVQGAWFPPPGL